MGREKHTLGPDTLAGASAGACAKTLVAPLERIKVLMQLMASRGGMGSVTISGMARDVWAKEGVRGLYRGNGTNVLRVAPVYAVKFGVNDYYLYLIAQSTGRSSAVVAAPSSGQLLLAGAATGLTQMIISLPLDVVRTRLTVGVRLHPPMLYNGIAHCMASIIRTEGVRGLYVVVEGFCLARALWLRFLL